MGSLTDENVLKKLKQAITTKLNETRQNVERELPEYIVSMITNKKPKSYMSRSLDAFIGEDTASFCDWIFNLVEKIETAEPNRESSPPKEETRKDKPSTSSKSEVKEVASRKRKGASPPLRGHKPIEAPKSDRNVSEKRPTPRRESPKRYDRDIKKVTRRQHSRSPRRRSREKVTKRTISPPRRKLRRTRSSSESHKTYSDVSSDEEQSNNVASLVVAQKRVVTAPTVSSQVSVKRNVRSMGDEKLMKARSKMFVNALTAASNSAIGEPKNKTRIIEKTISTDVTDGDINEPRVIRVTLDVSKPPTKRMEEQIRKIQLEDSNETSNRQSKRKHQEIVYDIEPDYSNYDQVELDFTDDEEDEEEIDKIVKESKIETPKQVVKRVTVSDEEPPSKRTRSNLQSKVAEAGEMEIKAKTRCSFWPNCSRGESCHFLHPNAVCAVFPKCSYGNSCHYVHPPCKFASACKNKKCSYTHADPSAIKLISGFFTPPANQLTRPPPNEVDKKTTAPILVVCGVTCRYKNNCKNFNCKYDHPTPCKFKANCISENCIYFHSPRLNVQPRPTKKIDNAKYRWVSKDQNNEILEINV